METFKKILLVDDEDDIVEVMTTILESEDFMVFTASSGNKAKQILQNQTIDVIISDIRMSDGNGIELLNFAKSMREKKHPLIYLVSGYSDISRDHAMRLGAMDLIDKPFKMSDLLNRIKTDFLKIGA